MNEIIKQRKGTLMTYSQEIKITVAHKFLQQEIDRDLAYEQDCNDLASQGFAPEFCKHGTYRWVDYDVMCPYCEDPDPEDRYSRSLRRAGLGADAPADPGGDGPALLRALDGAFPGCAQPGGSASRRPVSGPGLERRRAPDVTLSRACHA